MDAKLRTGDPFLVDLNISELQLRLSREQLTLLLDILNENFAGLGYTPTAIQLQEARLPAVGSSGSGRLSDSADVERDIVELLGKMDSCVIFVQVLMGNELRYLVPFIRLA